MKTIWMTFLLLAAFGAGARAEQTGPRRIEIAVTKRGFEPDKIVVKKGEPVTLVFTRKTDQTCAKKVVVYTSDKDKVERTLPLATPVAIDVTFAKSGELGYSCAMNMLGGVIQVQ